LRNFAPVITALIIIITVLFVVVTSLLLAPFIIEADTRVPYVTIRWMGIGKATITYQEEWKMDLQVFFFSKTIPLPPPEKKKTAVRQKKKKPGKQISFSGAMQKLWRVLKTFRVHRWQLALDTGDYTLNAKLYPVNYLPYCYDHVHVNFNDENYLYFSISNRPWKLLYAFLRR
jgi:hypothetical protein